MWWQSYYVLVEQSSAENQAMLTDVHDDGGEEGFHGRGQCQTFLGMVVLSAKALFLKYAQLLVQILLIIILSLKTLFSSAKMLHQKV